MPCHCGKSYADCRFPVSHSHPTINNIKLPGTVNRVMANRDRKGSMSLQDRMALNAVDIYPFDFPSKLDEVS